MTHPLIAKIFEILCADTVLQLHKGEIMVNGVDKQNSATCGSSPRPAAKKRYVQHFSGQGRKWEVVEGVTSDSSPSWYVHDEGVRHIRLPKSEYDLCPPVKVWRNVTAECAVRWGNIIHDTPQGAKALIWTGGIVDGYRLRHVVRQDGAAFIIEHEEEEA